MVLRPGHGLGLIGEMMATQYQVDILFALGKMGKHVYEGTVPAKVIAQRRAKNKVAKASRKRNR